MTIAYDVSGHGPAVVLLHAGVCDRRMWEPQATALLDAGYRVVRCDFRGFGTTPVATEPYRDADDVLTVLDILAVNRAALAGASYGGAVAAELAARWPDRVSALLLFSAALLGDDRSPELRAFNTREDELLSENNIVDATELNVATWLGPDAAPQTRALVATMQQHAFMIQRDAPQDIEQTSADFDLAAITCPCLAISGALDLIDFRNAAQHLPAVVRTAQHTELPWAAHLPTLERPTEANALMLSFLATAAPVSG